MIPSPRRGGMVVGQSDIAARVGVEILRKGGDAAVATAFAEAVALPRARSRGRRLHGARGRPRRGRRLLPRRGGTQDGGRGAGRGAIAAADLADYRPQVEEPIWSDYRGPKIADMPLTSSGLSVAEVMNILERFPMHDLGWGAAASLHVTSEPMKGQ